MEAPRLETSRLLLRGHSLADRAAAAAMWADPEVVRYVGGQPSSAEESWGRLLRYAGHWALLGFGYWAVEEKATGAFVGELGFADFRREITPSFEGAPEIGWALCLAAQHRGFAREALGAACAWGDVNLEADRTVCLIDPQHAVSLRLASELGYREFARTTYRGQAGRVLLERPRVARVALPPSESLLNDDRR